MAERPEPADLSDTDQVELDVVGPGAGEGADDPPEGFVDRLRHAQTGTDDPNIVGDVIPLEIVPLDAPAGPVDPAGAFPDATGVDQVEI